MENIYPAQEGASVERPLEVFTNIYGEEVQVRIFPGGYDGDPLLNALKIGLTVERDAQ